jgi:hypothetical protein
MAVAVPSADISSIANLAILQQNLALQHIARTEKILRLREKKRRKSLRHSL